MKISYNWLKKHLETALNATQLSELLTDIGLEVELLKENNSDLSYLKDIIAGDIKEIEKHPKDKGLNILRVDIKQTLPLCIISRATNLSIGDKIWVARKGAFLPSKEKKGDLIAINTLLIKGIPSEGMACSAYELGLGEDHESILLLDPLIAIGENALSIYGNSDDFLFEIGLTPNRADAMSHYGVARDLYVALKARGHEATLYLDKQQQSPSSAKKLDLIIEIKEDLCIRYSARAIFNIKVAPSPLWLKKYLKSIGLDSINNIVDISNFILHGLGQPLHIYDLDDIKGGKIKVSTLKEQTTFKTLDKKERKTTLEDLLIYDEKGPLALAGIMGGERSMIKKQTKNILIESACFDPIAIRKSSKHHDLNTDASFRFERGIDPNQCLDLLEKSLYLLKDIAGGELSTLIDIYPQKREKVIVDLRYEKIKKILGAEIHKDKIKQILSLLEMELLLEKEGLIQLAIPTYRIDIQKEIDLIEEIARIYGYNALEGTSKIHFTPQIEGFKKTDFTYKNLANQLISHGFYETISLSIEKNAYKELYSKDKQKQLISLLNPISQDLSLLRGTLLLGMLDNIQYNLNRQNEHIKFFEKGKVYFKKNDTYEEKEILSLIIALKEEKKEEMILSPFFYLKGILEQLLKRTYKEDLYQKKSSCHFLQEGIDFYSLSNEKLAKIGILKKEITDYFSIKEEISYGEIYWDRLETYIAKEKHKFSSLSKYPLVKRDLSLLIDAHICFEEIYQLIKKSYKKDLLKKVELFDTYQGDKLPFGKKSYALRFYLQDKEKSLDEKQIESTMKEIEILLKEALSISLR